MTVEASSSPSLTDVGRSLLNSLLLIATSLLLLLISCAAFLFFYHHNVPAIGVVAPVHLQHHLQANPYALVPLEFSTAKLTTAQSYRVSVELTLADSPRNHQMGNFMVELSMEGADAQTTIQVARSAIMPYHSPLIQTASTLLQSAPILLGVRKEQEKLRIELLEQHQFESGWLTTPSQARVEIHAPNLEIYTCRLLFETRLSGLPWVLYHFKITSFLLFTTLFWFSSMLAMLLTWGVGTFALQNPSTAPAATPSLMPSKAKKSAEIKQEEVEEERPWERTYSRAASSVETSFFDFDHDRPLREGSVGTEATTVEGDPYIKVENESD